MEVTKIIIKTKCGRKFTIEPNETHSVTIVESPVVTKVFIGNEAIPTSINSITAIVVHPKNISTDRIDRAVIKLANNH